MKTCFKGVRLHCLTLLLGMFSAGLASGQAPAETTGALAPPLWRLDPLGQGTTQPLPCAPYQDENGPLLIDNPLLDSWPARPGWVFGAETNIVAPVVLNKLFSSVTRASGATDTVALPTAQLGATVMPKFELGYRMGQTAGELTLSYTFMVGQATQNETLLGAFGTNPTALRSRIDYHVIDLEYGSWEPKTVFGWDMKWRVGLRGLLSFNDSQADNGTTSQTVSNHYIGLGPVGSVDFRRQISNSGFSWFGRAEMSMLTGKMDQRYFSAVTTGGVQDAGETTQFNYSQITTIAFQAGLNWAPQWNDHIRVTGGYMYQHIYDLGSFGTGNAPREQLSIQGGFVRAEWNY